MNIRNTLASLALLAAATQAPAALAQSANDTFDVTITITSACSIDAETAGDIAFGSHPSTATNIDSTGVLSITCTPQTGYTVALGNGVNNDGSGITGRRMLNQAVAGTYVPYQLYNDAARETPWGSSTGTVPGTGTGTPQTLTVYGRVPNANFPAGSYLDTVTATVTY
ncbi:MAG: spore coat U domain-containing protein [Luteimonas sp.]|nr:spore coat U domain-containing protein [Luteimonas sp.]